MEDEWYKGAPADSNGPYDPQPINTIKYASYYSTFYSNQPTPHSLNFCRVTLNNELTNLVAKFSEHYHDAWAKRKLENGWNFGDSWSDETKSHPRLKPPHMLSEYERERYREPIRDSLKALLALGWNIEYADYDSANSNRNSMRRSSVSTQTNYFRLGCRHLRKYRFKIVDY